MKSKFLDNCGAVGRRLYYLTLKLQLTTPQQITRYCSSGTDMCKRILNKVNNNKPNWIEGIFGLWCKSTVKRHTARGFRVAITETLNTAQTHKSYTE